MHLPDSALPGLFHAADRASLAAQRRFLIASRLRLGLLVAAAVSGALTLMNHRAIDFAAVGTVVALLGSAVVELWLLKDRPERTWYDGRALAESAKTTAWRFAVAGAPFGAALDARTAERLLADQLMALLRDAPSSSIGLTSGMAITTPMRTLRASDLEHRRATYVRERIDDQISWYATKARQNERHGSYWRIALLTVEATGVVAALFRATGHIRFDLAGIVAAVAAAFVAWLSLKQHESLARAYAFAANELAIASTRLHTAHDETGWSTEVDNAEQAISREHTMWRASRSSL
ncbi:DUF4231 domain-containing protein [Pseudonocardia xinjiangensis]|uniref:DUF4231 domain-containing protein n=1 Tax=Pseudonocardia xinjiangensis TaxID=75289 RepID=UPI003D8E01EF